MTRGDSPPLATSEESSRGHPQQPNRTLKLLPLIALIYYEVSGGPFGTEEAVRGGGPLLAIIGFLVFPLVWSIPEALITTELATAFPENSGYVAWVTEAFGPYWGFQEGYWSWVSGFIDNSVYPIYIADTLSIWFGQLNRQIVRISFVMIVNFTLSYVNYRGIHIVGAVSVCVMLLVLAPFMIMFIMGVRRVRWSQLAKVDTKSFKARQYINTLFWNLNYWDSVSTLAGEVANPQRNFPRAMFFSVILVTLTYVLPIIVAAGAVSASAEDWSNGFYVTAATKIGGNVLGSFVLVSTAVSNIGLFLAEMSSDSYQLSGMAQRGMLPSVFATKSKHGTPTVGIGASCAAILVMVWLPFETVIEILNQMYCAAQILEFSAFIRLKQTRPDIERAFKVSTWLSYVMVVAPSVFAVFVLLMPAWEGDWIRLCIVAFLLFLGTPLYYFVQSLKRMGVTFAKQGAEMDVGGDTAYLLGQSVRPVHAPQL